ncbi:hypothetical protein P154DRAFT_480762 [Amniculicola lignicola CBS 123094]|uniref:Uncharacterized protein n=1 Tax=Amniculicola lignicola CBS 123094 TaxID=1392246 RepID=A0A6A5X2Y2_9PLEO|nr:hypothetical protein P154DRAFT_480762 [Amniculicola lignicola CBS 123094]
MAELICNTPDIGKTTNQRYGKEKINWKDWPDDFARKNNIPPELGFDDLQPPELVDQSLLEWGLDRSSKWDGPKATIDVLFGNGSNLAWKYQVSDGELEDIVRETGQDHLDTTGESLRVFFIKTTGTRVGWLPGNFSIHQDQVRTLQKAGLSSILLCAIYSSKGYWAKMGSHCFTHRNQGGDITAFEIAYRYICGWDTGVSFTQFVRTQYGRTYFCINYSSSALNRLKPYVDRTPSLAYRDFFIDAISADESLKEMQIDIDHRRESLIKHEKKYEDEDIIFDTATRELHRLARHWLTLTQDLTDFHIQLKFLKESYHKYVQLAQDPKHNWIVSAPSNIAESLDVLKSQCDNYVRWTTVYRDRTNIRINLLFHLVNQRESRTNTQIATSTAKVAEQTQRDSSSMITIAAVTMFFLPGTFVSAILSTTFFEYGPDELQVSSKWWILLAVTIPLMIAVFASWFGWQYVRFGKKTISVKLPS